MPGHDDERDHPSETVQAMVERATASIRVDIDNLERIYEPLKEKGNDNSYEIRRLKEITDDLKKNEAVLSANLQKLSTDIDRKFANWPLVQRLVFGTAAIMLVTVITFILSHSGLSVKPL